MEISMIGSSNPAMGRPDLAYRELFSGTGNCEMSRNRVLCFGQGRSSRGAGGGVRLSIKAVQSVAAVVSGKVSSSAPEPKSVDGVKVVVGLPLDAVSECGSVKHGRAIAAGLKALKLLGVEGVELPVWWGLVEKEAMGKYDWSAYLTLAEMVQKAGLQLHVSLSFHACNISLPRWVSALGESNPDIFFADKSGHRYRDCLSLGIDHVPALNGKTALQVYQHLCDSFNSAFAPLMGSTIKGISMGLGPGGELRYPSHQVQNRNEIKGVGEFQCYDKNMLGLLKQHAESAGNPSWGLSGPHDTPGYDQVPSLFFNDHGGSWESPYGDFFLSWYSDQLISHGDRLLSLASSTFSGRGVAVYGKVPLIDSWYRTRAHAAELTAGYYNTVNTNGYQAVAQTFADNSCKMVLPGMDVSDEMLLVQILEACEKSGVEVSGQNSSASSGRFEQIKKKLSRGNVVSLFTYQRMGAAFFSPEHFPSFTKFVRSLNQQELHSDDLASGEVEETSLSVHANAGSDSRMQVA